MFCVLRRHLLFSFFFFFYFFFFFFFLFFFLTLLLFEKYKRARFWGVVVNVKLETQLLARARYGLGHAGHVGEGGVHRVVKDNFLHLQAGQDVPRRFGGILAGKTTRA